MGAIYLAKSLLNLAHGRQAVELKSIGIQFLSVVLVLLAGSTLAQTTIRPSSTIIVATINLEGGGRHLRESGRQTTERYFRIAHQFFMPAEGLWSLIGLTELRYRRDQPNPASHVVLDSLQFNCSRRDTDVPDVYGAQCFGKYTEAAFAKTDRALGYNANLTFEPIPDSFRNSFLGEQRGTYIRRTVMGARFRAKYTGIIVPFYVVHLSGYYRKELIDLIEKLHSWHVPGDMPPVVVGDFNCHDWYSGDQQLVLNEFVDVSAGVREVMRILISRPQHYPNAGVKWGRPQRGDARLIDLGGKQFTDHSAVSAVLRIDRTESSEASWPPPKAQSDVFHPMPFMGLSLVSRAACIDTLD
jgi:hypothetical protein